MKKIVLLSIPVFIFLSFFFSKSSFAAGAKYVSDINNELYRCSNSGSLSDNGVEGAIPPPTGNGNFLVIAHCDANEKCVDSAPGPKDSRTGDQEQKNVATCTPVKSVSTTCTCHVPGGPSVDTSTPNNGQDCPSTSGGTVQNAKYCPAWDSCVNDQGSGAATCPPLPCVCNGTGTHSGSGNNGMNCTRNNGDVFTTYCETWEQCVDNGQGQGHASCQSLTCTCDHANSTNPNENGFSCTDGTRDTCHGDEICTGAPGKASCQYSSQAGTTTDTNKLITPPPPPCGSAIGATGGCTGVNTALGLLGTDPQSLVKTLFGVLLSLSGGIAVLLIMLSGYRMILSQGDPEKIGGAREQLTAAIIGLLFLIFSLVILQVIGVDVLHLPGFGGSAGSTTPTTPTSLANSDCEIKGDLCIASNLIGQSGGYCFNKQSPLPFACGSGYTCCRPGVADNSGAPGNQCGGCQGTCQHPGQYCVEPPACGSGGTLSSVYLCDQINGQWQPQYTQPASQDTNCTCK